MSMDKTYKEPKSLDEQIKHLKENKRVVFNEMSEEEAKEILYKYNYINVITPFKHYFAKTNIEGEPIKINDMHVYERDVDFKEYYYLYVREREMYPPLYSSLLKFEETFNAILSYEVIRYYLITTHNRFLVFVDVLLRNLNKANYNARTKEHMSKTINDFDTMMSKYDNLYIFFDRLSLTSLATIFRCCDDVLKMKIFNSLVANNCSYNFYDFETFDSALTKIIQIRNCVCHGNSIEILCRYYNIKSKSLRMRSDRRKYRNLINRLTENE